MEINDPKLAEKIADWNRVHPPRKTRQRLYYDVDAEDLQYRFSVDEQKNPTITGYAAVFNRRTKLWDGFYEQVAPGAFSESLASNDIYALFNHDVSKVLGSTGAKNLTLSEDERGLLYVISPVPETATAREVVTLIKTGIIRKSSFAFAVEKYSDEKIDSGTLRTIVKASPLYDVSPVTYPAYKDTEAHVRMIEGEFERAWVFDDGREPIILCDEPKKPVNMDDWFDKFKMMGRPK